MKPHPIILALVLLLVAGVAALQWYWRDSRARLAMPAGEARVRPKLAQAVPPETEPVSAEAFQQRMETALTPEVLGRFLKAKGRSPARLALMTRITRDRDYLVAAAAAFPEDPLPQLMLCQWGRTPAERATAVDAFRRLDPDNALGDLLAARQELDAFRLPEAMALLRAAGEKSRLDTYAAELGGTMEELYQFAGFSPLDAKVAAYVGGLSDPHATLVEGLVRRLTAKNGTSEFFGKPLNDDETLEVGVALGQLAQDQAGSAYEKFSGLTAELMALQLADPEKPVPGLDNGKTAAQRMEELVQWKKEFRDLVDQMSGKFFKLSPQDKLAYLEKAGREGEVTALQWLADRDGGR
jgi:hypothetical protein